MASPVNDEQRRNNPEAYTALRGKLAHAIGEALGSGADPEELAEAVMAVGEIEWMYQLMTPQFHEFKLIVTVAGRD